VRDADSWQEQARRHEGSWWPAWHAWLLQHGSGALVSARRIDAGNVLGDAPGSYVLQRFND